MNESMSLLYRFSVCTVMYTEAVQIANQTEIPFRYTETTPFKIVLFVSFSPYGNQWGASIFYLAAGCGLLDIASLLLDKGADIEEVDEVLITPFCTVFQSFVFC
jgi:hypothetical protein